MKNYIICILFMFAFLIFLGGCQKDNSVEDGFINDNSEESNPFCFAYSSEINEYDINDITFNVYCGYRFEVYSPSEHPNDNRILDVAIIANYDIYPGKSFNDVSKGIDIFTLKKLDDFADKTKYSVSIDKKGKITFPTSYQVTIPKEMFEKENGVFNMGVRVQYGELGEPGCEGYYKWVNIKYEIVDNIVRLNKYSEKR